ncbi:MAG: NfeD family protein [Bacteroidota bacterium]
MTVTGIILLILLGIILILLEFLVIPGVTVAGIGGVLSLAAAVYLAYDNYGNEGGNYALAGTSVVVITSLVFALRSRTWKKLMLRSSIDYKINAVELEKVKAGDIGISVSRLAPMGKIQINDEFYEAKSMNEFIDQNTEIVVRKIENNIIIVKPLNT